MSAPEPVLDPSAAADPARPVALAPGVVRVTAPNPGPMTGPGTNSYLVGTTEVVVVDPGPDEAAHLDALVEAGDGRIRWIVVTHTHPDHAPAAATLAERTGAEVVGFDARDGFAPDRSVGDGFELAGEGFCLRALHTPGHASNHLCWLLLGEQMLFSGDHVMQGSTVVISPPDGDMAQYLTSLGRLLELDPPISCIAPGHGSLIGEPAPVVRGIIDHRLGREAKVLGALQRAGRATVDELVPVVYDDVHEVLHPVARRSLWAHLRKLADDGRVTTDDREDEQAHWAAG
ncbi:MAG TPA: MBL fold metallo-hydrolase [Acidimicrobiales bacterium]|nr:MBL fold metallo-hydrolase [Acidimicrobiales bacterium]